jgi:hypothetical protein
VEFISVTIKKKSLVRAAAILCIFAAVGCKTGYTITITGAIKEYTRYDSVFVTLTNGWEGITSPPDSFSIDKKGRYFLRIRGISNTSPPITFVKNGQFQARLKIYDIDEFSPIIMNETSGAMSKIQIESDSSASAEVSF